MNHSSVNASEIAFVDPGVSRRESFLTDLRTDLERILRDVATPALSQFCCVLSGHPDTIVDHIGADYRSDEIEHGWVNTPYAQLNRGVIA